MIQVTAGHTHSGTRQQQRTPDTEIVGRIQLAFIRISPKYRSKGGMPSTETVRGQIGGSIRIKQHGER